MMQVPPSPVALDPSVFSEVVAPTLAFVVVILAIGGVVRWILRSPVGEALAERLRRSGGAPPDDVRKQLAELVGEVHQLRTEVSELSERVDFTERLLAKSREGQRIGPGP